MEQSNNGIHAITCEKIRSSQDNHYSGSEINKSPMVIFERYVSRQTTKRNTISIEKDLLIKPTGKTIADIVRMRPGALVWNHGEEFVERARAQPNEIRAPPMKELINILSILMRAFFAPIRETSSVV
jgi:hypothetical protein